MPTSTAKTPGKAAPARAKAAKAPASKPAKAVAKAPGKAAPKAAEKPAPRPSAKRPAKPPAPKAAKKPAKKPVGFDAEFVARLAPWLRALRGYTRLKADGLENIPEGPAILAANHTGWLGLDYALTAIVVHDERGRTPRGMVHSAWFVAPATAQFARRVGLSKVSKEAMAEGLAAGHLVMVFPEGEKGAFRAGSDYTLTEFARGFVRTAMATGCPVIPVAVLGGEESNPVDKTIRGYEDLLRMPIPVPRNLLPKPVKWRIRFLPAIDFKGYTEADAADTERVHAIAEDVRTRIQRELRILQQQRGHPYI